MQLFGLGLRRSTVEQYRGLPPAQKRFHAHYAGGRRCRTDCAFVGLSVNKYHGDSHAGEEFSRPTELRRFRSVCTDVLNCRRSTNTATTFPVGRIFELRIRTAFWSNRPWFLQQLTEIHALLSGNDVPMSLPAAMVHLPSPRACSEQTQTK